MPGETGVTVVTYARVLFLHCTWGCGRNERPAFPAPSDFFEGRTLLAKLARRRRERGGVAVWHGKRWRLRC